MSRFTCVSTNTAGFPNAVPTTTLAVLRPTPCNVVSSSIVSGTLPPNSSTTFFAASRIDFVF
jgi:hypothetical protein